MGWYWEWNGNGVYVVEPLFFFFFLLFLLLGCCLNTMAGGEMEYGVGVSRVYVFLSSSEEGVTTIIKTKK